VRAFLIDSYILSTGPKALSPQNIKPDQEAASITTSCLGFTGRLEFFMQTPVNHHGTLLVDIPHSAGALARPFALLVSLLAAMFSQVGTQQKRYGRRTRAAT
jgi:hypothetical protein